MVTRKKPETVVDEGEPAAVDRPVTAADMLALADALEAIEPDSREYRLPKLIREMLK